jgi:hypothetical protein
MAMKSIPAALLTDIDLDIWECLMNRWGAGLRPKAHESDQRDADLSALLYLLSKHHKVYWLWRRCRCGNIWAIEPRYGDTT